MTDEEIYRELKVFLTDEEIEKYRKENLSNAEIYDLVYSVFQGYTAKSADEFGDDKTEFVWTPYIPIGDYTVLMADGGTGKTIFCCGIASALSRGEPLPSESITEKTAPTNTLIISAEDRGELLKKRLVSSGADLQTYSPVYLKTLHNQLSAIFNHAVKFYGLKENPAAKVGNMGKSKNREMLFWTQEEYQKFAFAVMNKPISYYAFEMLYWCGIREGELLALTAGDFDFEHSTVTINKSYQRIDGRDVITDPKTTKSNRVIKMPDFLAEEIKTYISKIYGLKKNDRIFNISKNYLHREMTRGADEAGIKRIRIHDLRHSHISLLIEMGYSAVAIAERVGHESINITYNYAHLFPSTQTDMADKLNKFRKDTTQNVS